MKYIVNPRGDRCYLFSLSFRELFGRIGKRKRRVFYSRDFDFLESEIWINRPTTWEERERKERDDQREFEGKVRQ